MATASSFHCLCNRSLGLKSKARSSSMAAASLRPARSAGLSPGMQISPNRKSTWRRQVALSVVCEAAKMADAELVTLDHLGLSKLPASQGIYAVFDKNGTLQYVGMSRRISTSVQNHARNLPSELCTSVKVATMDTADREGLREAWEAWVREHFEASGSVPPGNEPGNKSWSSRMKPTKQDLKLKPSKTTELTIPLEQLIDKLVKDFKVVAFIKGTRASPQCGFSHRVLTILNEQHVDYETVNVLDEDHNSGVREAIKAYSQWPTIPQVFVDGEFVGGADVLNEMAESGEIAKLLSGKTS